MIRLHGDPTTDAFTIEERRFSDRCTYPCCDVNPPRQLLRARLYDLFLEHDGEDFPRERDWRAENELLLSRVGEDYGKRGNGRIEYHLSPPFDMSLRSGDTTVPRQQPRIHARLHPTGRAPALDCPVDHHHLVIALPERVCTASAHRVAIWTHHDIAIGERWLHVLIYTYASRARTTAVVADGRAAIAREQGRCCCHVSSPVACSRSTASTLRQTLLSRCSPR